MKTIGLVGGTTWNSTIDYYRILNEEIGSRLGNDHSAKIILSSVDFREFKNLVDEKGWPALVGFLSNEAKKLQAAGADFFLIGANTLHKVAGEVARSAPIPLLSILDVVAEEIARRKYRKVGLLGTRLTMEDGFFAAHLKKAGIETLVPGEKERGEIDRVIFEELARGRTEEGARRRFQEIISGLASRGAEGVVLGCTEIPLLIREGESPIPALDTIRLHAVAAAAKALEP
jgi:aspartate racemase